MKKVYLMWVVFAYILAGCNGNTATHGEHEHEAHEHEAHEHEEGHDHDHEGHDHEHEVNIVKPAMIMNMKRPEKDMPVKSRLRKHWRKRSDCRRLRLGRVLLPM